MLDGAVPNLLLPLLIGMLCVLVAAVLLRADTTSFGKRLAAGLAGAPVAEQAAGSPADLLGRSVAGGLRAGSGLFSASDAQEVPLLMAAVLRGSGAQHPELSSFAAVFSGAMRPSVPPAFRRAIGGGAPSSSPAARSSAPPGRGNTAR